MADNANQQVDNQNQHFAIQRIFIKDLSFEAPGAPDIFQKEWKPELNLDVNTESKQIQDDIYEVILTLTVNVKSEDKNAFLVQVKQAGIFTIKGFPGEHMDHTLKAFCPTVLFPYAREVVTDMVTRGSFPQLVLAPINFEALFAQHAEQQSEDEATTH